MRRYDTALAFAPAALPGVLNPALYSRMLSYFGRVMVHKPGERLYEASYINPVPGYANSQIIAHGEQYRVNCPFCGDTTSRCYINHTFGIEDDRGWPRYLWKCFNEDCHQSRTNTQRLAEQLVGFINVANRGKTTLAELYSRAVVAEPPEVVPYMPGDVTPLSWLMDNSPNHAAVKYMVGERRYTKPMLDKYQISYCNSTQLKLPLVIGRAILPYFKGNGLFGWQARYLGTPPVKTIPKYFNMPGIRKSAWLYNLDAAMQQDMLVIVEGLPAVHFIGDKAVALLGSSMSPMQCDLVVQYFANKPVVVWLDNNKQKDAETICGRLRGSGLFVVNVVPPNAWDPADYGTENSWRIIFETLKNAINVKH